MSRCGASIAAWRSRIHWNWSLSSQRADRIIMRDGCSDTARRPHRVAKGEKIRGGLMATLPIVMCPQSARPTWLRGGLAPRPRPSTFLWTLYVATRCAFDYWLAIKCEPEHGFGGTGALFVWATYPLLYTVLNMCVSHTCSCAARGSSALFEIIILCCRTQKGLFVRQHRPIVGWINKGSLRT